MQNINIDGSLCLKNRWDSVDCNVCIEFCPTSAITINGKIEIKADKCNECGICMSQCRTGVFSFADAERRYYLTTSYPQLVQNGHGLPFIICQKKAGNYSFLPNCMGMFSETDLALAVLELKKNIFIYGGDCRKCSITCSPLIDENINSANKILSLLNVPWKIKNVLEWINLDIHNVLEKILDKEEERGSLSRRNFFRRLSVNSMNTATSIVLNDGGVEEEGPATVTSPRREKWIPSKRKKLNKFFEESDVPSDKKVYGSDLPFYKLEITDNCILCNICHDFCPTGAIRKYEDGFETGLEFDALKCIRCTDCEKLCPEGAIKKYPYIKLSDLKNNSGVRMAHKELVECVECEMKFLPVENEQKCRRCFKLGKIADSIFSY